MTIFLFGCPTDENIDIEDSNNPDLTDATQPEPEPESEPEILTYESVQYDDILIKTSPSLINIFIKSASSATWSDHYLEFNLVRKTNPLIRQDLFRLIELYNVLPSSKSGAFVFNREYESKPIANSGGWETAIRENNTPDFMGGFHGYEELISYELNIDNQLIHPIEDSTLQTAKRVTFIQTTDLISLLSGNPIATHIQEYSFNVYGITLKQTINWKNSTEILFSYLTMFPILRKIDIDSGSQITDTATRLPEGTYEDISENTFDITRTYETSSVTLTGAESGFTGTISVIRSSQLPNASMFITNALQYNKVYFDFSGMHNVSPGEIWEIESHYDLYVNK